MNYGLPFRLPYGLSATSSNQIYLGSIYNQYNSSLENIPQWINTSSVYYMVSTSSLTASIKAPYGRYDQGVYNSENPYAGCNTLPLGTCGNWIIAGDYFGVASNIVKIPSDIIYSTASNDSTHNSFDHNTYIQSGSVNLAGSCNNIGGQWILAKKQWHGRPSFNSTDCLGGSAPNPNTAPDNVRYLTKTVVIGAGDTGNATTLYPSPTSSSIVNWYGSLIFQFTMTVDRYTGIMTLTNYQNTYTFSGTISGWLVNTSTTELIPPGQTIDFIGEIVTNDVGVKSVSYQSRMNGTGSYLPTDTWSQYEPSVTGSIAPYGELTTGPQNNFDQSGTNPYVSLRWFAQNGDLCNGKITSPWLYGFNVQPSGSLPSDWDTAFNDPDQTWPGYLNCPTLPDGNPASTAISGSVYATDTIFSCSYGAYASTPSQSGLFQGYGTITQALNMSIQLSDPYYANDCYGDYINCLNAWDMSDLATAQLRQDELLADAPLCIYDEINYAATPNLIAGYSTNWNAPIKDSNGFAPWTSMNNPPTYSSWSYVPSQSADWTPTFNTQSWTDPNDTYWSYNANGLYFNDASVITLGNILVAGATFHTGLRQTKIISHSISGSQKHFWFNYAKLKREQNPTYGYWEWFNDVWGAYSDGNIPSTALRWMDNYEAQYDPDTNLPLPPPGNFPQSFYNQYNSKIVGAKYIQTKIQAPSVNFMRPYGADKWSVDQESVCMITSGTPSSGSALTIQKTFNAQNPTTGSGIQIGDTVMVQGSSIYSVADIEQAGTVYTLTLGDVVSAICTGSNFNDIATAQGYDITNDYGYLYIGRMRFFDAPPFGLEQVVIRNSVSGSAFTFTNPKTYWLTGSSTNVDIYGTSMNPQGYNVPSPNALFSNVTITKLDDYTAFASGSDYSSGKWVVPAGKYPWLDDSSPKGTFVNCNWTFDYRGMQSGYSGSISWYDGITGSTAIIVHQGQAQFTPCCPSIVGIVPFTSGSASVEHFNNQALFAMPSSAGFDNVYGAHGQSYVSTVMIDPFYQAPFFPNTINTEFTWQEDDGTGKPDTDTARFYPYHTLVEALAIIPNNGGWYQNQSASLPSGISLQFDTGSNTIYPPTYPNGIQIGDDVGNYGSQTTEWGFNINACGTINSGGRFANVYKQFVIC